MEHCIITSNNNKSPGTPGYQIYYSIVMTSIIIALHYSYTLFTGETLAPDDINVLNVFHP